MRFTDKIKYNIKRSLPILAIAGAGLMSSCSKDDEPEVPKHDVELRFMPGYYEEVELDIVKKHADDPYVRMIYLIPARDGRFLNFNTAEHLHNLTDFFQERFDIAPNKIKGRGNFQFIPGLVAKEDSLWYVKHGWTINQHNQKQK